VTKEDEAAGAVGRKKIRIAPDPKQQLPPKRPLNKTPILKQASYKKVLVNGLEWGERKEPGKRDVESFFLCGVREQLSFEREPSTLEIIDSSQKSAQLRGAG